MPGTDNQEGGKGRIKEQDRQVADKEIRQEQTEAGVKVQSKDGEKDKEVTGDMPRDDTRPAVRDKTWEQMGLHRMKKTSLTKFKGPKKGSKLKAQAKLGKKGLDKQLTLGNYNFEIKLEARNNPVGNSKVIQDQLSKIRPCDKRELNPHTSHSQ